MNDIVTRLIEPEELGLAADLRERMTREIQGDGDESYDPRIHDRFVDFYRARIAAGSSATFVAEHAGALCGLASVYRLVNHRSEIFDQPSAYVSNVYVKPQYRRRGVATTLTRMCVDWARARGCVVVRLRTSAMGRNVYSAMGFVQSDEMELPL
ncbi:MAG TPA: GNAT family N-acetyltransferase [Candidatus Eremiobacteraceae bacterium]|nr:GNAT family N-acetyltransferase [Candidatus Eremiobacteraceae bacterium]